MEEEESSGQQAQQSPRRQQRAFVPLRSRNRLIHHCRLNQIAASGRAQTAMVVRRGTGVARSPRSTELSHSLPEVTRWTTRRAAPAQLCYAITLIFSVWKPHVKVVSVKWASCKTFVFLPVGAAMSYHFFIWSSRLIIREKSDIFKNFCVRVSLNLRFYFVFTVLTHHHLH